MFLLLSGIFLKTNYAGAQTSDTICVNVDGLRRLHARADSTPILLDRVNLLEADRRTMTAIVQNATRRDSLNAALITSYQQSAIIAAERYALYDAELLNTRTLLKKERRKRTWLSIGGLAGIAAGIYFGTKL